MRWVLHLRPKNKTVLKRYHRLTFLQIISAYCKSIAKQLVPFEVGMSIYTCLSNMSNTQDEAN